MAHIKQAGILAPASDAIHDADVIMTAAVVGHAYSRLSNNSNCAFDFEADADPGEDARMAGNWERHKRAVAKINKALETKGGKYGKPGAGKEAIVGITPAYDRNGNIMRITGGAGDLPLDSQLRYNPPLPADLAGSQLYQLATEHTVGYQGRGAYTGFIQGRESGQSNLFSTYRQRVPGTFGRRWLPSVKPNDNGSPIGKGETERIWGMIASNQAQGKLKKDGMYFQDQDTARGANGLTTDDIVGYTHGMIQAIYDVEMWKLVNPHQHAGTPYEIAVGTQTTKLASCFTCAIFMQANGYPASATHLGRGESWLPLYAENGKSKQDQTRSACNDKWASYCKLIIDEGIACIENRLATDKHKASMRSLKDYLARKAPLDYANLVLDAVTVHEHEVVRVDRTLLA
ncbi:MULTISPECIES: hypothetical protein [unclassified Janthinobacterium]|uniref:hypothetical protein n=1 Tax=unclassified Janthinobacterium TaxID=2610881 RepID=UPI001614392B|nr:MULTISPECIES: hypothetical protein [unclassified Janthinobacterium]MBB5368985.1 hypothetical protein [Janthinobacterium sp. K2C7]MBB5381479.1 hypothetical protein [Janthinobacterium sp. K2Li3]MBB5387367.1 hypothetical protein [Janthinobacterium sp. K2E3]